MPLNPADKKFDLDLQERVKKLEDRVKSLEGHVDKKLKPKSKSKKTKKFPTEFHGEKAEKYKEFLKRWETHDKLFGDTKAAYEGGFFPKGKHDELIAARRALQKERRKYRLAKPAEALGPDEIKDAKRAEVFKPPTGGFSGGDEGLGFTGAARYGVRPSFRANAIGTSAGSGLRYGRRF